LDKENKMALSSTAKNKLPFTSLVDGSSNFWTASGSGTNEYYYNQTTPDYKPLNVQENGTDMTEGTAGSLNAGEWAWGDNDTIGENRIYVRLSDGADPDSKAADYVECSAPVDIMQAEAGKETIIIGMIISNNEELTVDADVVLLITDNADALQFSMQFTIKAEDAAITFSEKIVMNAEEKLKILCDKEYMGVHVSIDSDTP
jgi:hypothetical protein